MQQHPLMVVHDGGAGVSFDAGRDAAIRIVAEAYEVALTRLHPLDVEERAWFQERLRDARVAAGLPSVEPLTRASSRRPA